MKRLPTGLIIFDTFDIICISISAGSTVGFIFKKYKNYRKRLKGEDPIVSELKKNHQ